MREYAKKGKYYTTTEDNAYSFIPLNGTIETPLILFLLKPGLVCKKIHRFVQYTLRKIFNNFIQSAEDSRRQGDENSNSSVIAETMKLLANSS